jgi:hypothetical protein
MREGIGRTRAAHEDQQLLTRAEERALVKWLTHLTASGYPARHCFLQKMAGVRLDYGPFILGILITRLYSLPGDRPYSYFGGREHEKFPPGRKNP